MANVPQMLPLASGKGQKAKDLTIGQVVCSPEIIPWAHAITSMLFENVETQVRRFFPSYMLETSFSRKDSGGHSDVECHSGHCC